MRLLTLLALVGCAPVAEHNATALADRAPAPPFAMELEASNFIAGATATLDVHGAPPGATVNFAYTLNGLGAGPCVAVLGGACLDIRAPVIAFPVSAIADAAGNATLSFLIPPTANARYPAFQAVVLGGFAQLSNPIGRLVGGPGIVLTPNGDRDGDGVTLANGDCADHNASIFPGALDWSGDAVDQNCDNFDGFDLDGDGFAPVAWGGDDCDDTNPAVSPGQADVCDGADNDCDGAIDAGPWGASCSVEEVFTGGNRPIDMLFVVDDSGSMAEEQGRLAFAIVPFLDAMVRNNVDLHLGVVTTDTDTLNAGRLVTAQGQRFIAPAAGVNYAAWATTAVSVGTNGSPDEKGLDASFLALTPPLVTGYNAGFYRPNADLAVVFVTDENDFSTRISANAWVAGLAAMKPNGQEAVAHGIYGEVVCATADAGTVYTSVISATGGVSSSVCETDYGPGMAEIGAAVLSRAGGGGQTFILNAPANPATLEVEAQIPGLGVVLVAPGQYTYDPVTQVLEITGLVLPPGSVVTVRFDV
jgi:hypothetical protein